jgi:4-oxalocrotonate tautomerase
MPHIIIKMAEGRSDAIKHELASRLTDTMMEVLALDASAISVAVEDVPAQMWMQQVYVPDIESGAGRLFKSPGYGPLADPEEGDGH